MWRSSAHKKIRAENKKDVLFTEAGAANPICKFATMNNYTTCGALLVSEDQTNNDKLKPNEKEKIPDSDTINEKLIKFIGMKELNIFFVFAIYVDY